jgi:two-component system sensor histidine kinase MprB
MEPGLPNRVSPAPFGGASGYVQFLSPAGQVLVPGGQGAAPARIPPDASDRQIAARGSGRSFSDRTVRGTRLRVLTAGIGADGALMIARPLTEVESALERILLILVIVTVCGVALAALLGTLVARTALAPIVRFTRRTEQLTDSLDASQRLEIHGHDELARLATSFNATLAALEHSVEAQRQLIADASHELRTPMATLRANIQVLGEAGRLSAADRESLRRDIVVELDELTALVADLVELARGGARGQAEGEDVDLEEIVGEAVARARRRGTVRLSAHLEPATVRGEADRISRAVTNLLENARKWSPPDGLVEVALRDGILTVRDHGPGFTEADLPHVFERFYRAESARGLPGSGLGLAIVRQTAEAHGGHVSAANAPDGGAVIEVGFGQTRAPASPPAGPCAPPVASVDRAREQPTPRADR